MINSNLSSFQNGVNRLYDVCKYYGVTPSAKTPAAIQSAIDTFVTNYHRNGYNSGWNDGLNQGYNSGYTDGYNAAGGDVKHTVYAAVSDGTSASGWLRLYIDGAVKQSVGMLWSSGSNYTTNVYTI